MNIHQMQVRYQPGADRILWHVRTGSGELFQAWLTRRLLKMAWPHFSRMVVQVGLAQVLPGATPASVLPEARDMLAQAVRERPLANARFNEPFKLDVVAQPLGQEPLLPEAIDLGPGAEGRGLNNRLRDGAGRSIALQLNDDLATALMRLLDQALAESDWGLQSTPPADLPVQPRVLN
ncbi:MAG: hypothetical protein CFE45_19445 [Burkholderiales bacterium PBB5]|nr:MAG: hypothetical protein CFE45_19445 [Burkholderiales bacterium PBB5]